MKFFFSRVLKRTVGEISSRRSLTYSPKRR